MPAKSKPRGPAEVLRLTLEVEASPEYVAKIATMYAETLRNICPEIKQGQVTMEVRNFAANTELRGWTGDGESAVRQLSELIDNPTEAVQKHEELVAAARTLANLSAELTPLRPKFWRGRKELRDVDDVFVRTMRAAGTDSLKRQASESPSPLTGDAITYSQIFHLKWAADGSRLQGRVRINGKLDDVDIADDLVEQAIDAFKTRKTWKLRLHGRWIAGDDGELHLRSPMLIEFDSEHMSWSGRQILAAARGAGEVFSASDFDRILSDLESRAAQSDG